MENSDGKLYLVATPIGNLEDITLRALRILKEADVIAAEDTRHTRILLDRYDIHTKMVSYHAFNEHHKTNELLEMVKSGKKVAMVSDAGTPGIADPGFLLAREAVKAGIAPQIIPGVSAVTFALAAAALPIDRFTFYGFLPVKSGRRGVALQQIAAENKTCIVFESPHRIAKLIQEVVNIIGSDTPIAVIREATKAFEEVCRGTAGEVAAVTANKKWKGECVMIINPRQQDLCRNDGTETDV
jgi:16S rRNA (cytidine1402-2'-O)-methyltransferase